MERKKIIKIGINEIRRIISECVTLILSEGVKRPSAINLREYLDTIPIDELRRQYYDFSIMKNVGGFGDRFRYGDENIVTEENVTTLSPKETKRTMLHQFGLHDWQVREINGTNGLTLILVIPNIGQNDNDVINGMRACGWSIGTSNNMVKNGMTWKEMTFEPMQQDMISDTLRSHHRYLYHWTLLGNYGNIMVSGLEPRSENNLFMYPERVHFLTDIRNTIRTLSIGQQLYSANSSSKNNGKYVLLSVDLSKVPDADFYYDPRLEGGVYTNDTIPPSAISVVMGYDFKNNQPLKI